MLLLLSLSREAEIPDSSGLRYTAFGMSVISIYKYKGSKEEIKVNKKKKAIHIESIETEEFPKGRKKNSLY